MSTVICFKCGISIEDHFCTNCRPTITVLNEETDDPPLDTYEVVLWTSQYRLITVNAEDLQTARELAMELALNNIDEGWEDSGDIDIRSIELVTSY